MTIAEESTAWPGVSRPTYLGGLGFGFKWNMGWMHDFLHYMSLDPIYRRFHQGNVTFSIMYAFQEHFILVLSHDEVVHGKGSLINKMPGDEWQKFANLRMFYAWMYRASGQKAALHGRRVRPGARMESRPWTRLGPDRICRATTACAGWCNISTTSTATSPRSGTWTTPTKGSSGSIFTTRTTASSRSCAARGKGEIVVFAVNATPVVRYDYRLGVPDDGFYREIINTDGETYGGSNVGNLGGLQADAVEWQGRTHSIVVNLPPLAVIAFKREAPADSVEEP